MSPARAGSLLRRTCSTPPPAGPLTSARLRRAWSIWVGTASRLRPRHRSTPLRGRLCRRSSGPTRNRHRNPRPADALGGSHRRRGMAHHQPGERPGEQGCNHRRRIRSGHRDRGCAHRGPHPGEALHDAPADLSGERPRKSNFVGPGPDSNAIPRCSRGRAGPGRRASAPTALSSACAPANASSIVSSVLNRTRSE